MFELDVAPQLSVANGHAVTTSLNIAEVFGKEHKNVLRDIKELEVPGEFTELNFELSEYKDSTGRKLPMYNITRDGFTILAMGFTGSKAMQFKLAYIDAFNKMEAELCRPKPKPEPSRLVGIANAAAASLKLFKTHLAATKAIGMKGNAAIIAADAEFAKESGFSFAGKYGVTLKPEPDKNSVSEDDVRLVMQRVRAAYARRGHSGKPTIRLITMGVRNVLAGWSTEKMKAAIARLEGEGKIFVERTCTKECYIPVQSQV